MATQTSNLGLTKPGYDEAADIVPAVNNNMDAIDAVMGAVPPNTSVQAQITANAQAIAKLDESIAIVSNGNTHAAIAAGQYVYIKGHGTLAEGLYTANSAISANATLSNSNVTAVSGGGLNALNSNLANCNIYMMVSQVTNASEATINTQSGRKFKFPGCFIVGALLTSDSRCLATTVIGITDFKVGNDNFVRYVADDETKITFHFKYVSETLVKAYVSNASGHFGRVMMFSFGTPET